MTTRILRPVLALFAAGASLAAITLNSGCLAVAAGAGAGAAVAYVRGQLEATVNGDYEPTIAATDRALQQLSIAKINETRVGLVDTIKARTAADKKLEIRLENSARGLTKIRIRVGIMGDEPLSIAILEKIKANL